MSASPSKAVYRHIPITHLSADELLDLSKKHKLSLSREDMGVIQAMFKEENREPTDVELEVIAPNLERALQAPHLRREDHAHAERANGDRGQPVQDLHPQRDAPHHGAEAGLRAQRICGQRGLREGGRPDGDLLEGGDTQPPERH